MTGVFADYARYYNALYQDKDYGAEADYFVRLVRQYEAQPSVTLLEFGAGSGRHQQEFAGRGLEAFGVEVSPGMIELARNRGARVTLGDFRDYDHGSIVDVVMALFHVVSYLVTDRDLEKGFANARRHLLPGGLFVFDVWHEDAVVNQVPEVRVKRISVEGLDIVRVAEPNWNKDDRVVVVNYTIFAKQEADSSWDMTTESHPMRYFGVGELEGLATAHRFEVCTMEETLTGAAPSEDSWGITAVLRAV